MIIVTGAAGFIGSQIVKALVREGKEVHAIDDLTDGRKFENLLDADIADYLDKDIFFEAILERMDKDPLKPIEAIIHNGAISSTTSWDGKAVMSANYDFSKILLNYCEAHGIPFIYASSASVYGANKSSEEVPRNERPLNVYGYSKLLFDNYVRKGEWSTRIVGLRYFNVYGPGEQFKGPQASPFFRYYKSLRVGNPVTVLEGRDGFGGKAEDTKRDFIHVDDVVSVVLWAIENDCVSGIFNVGTGQCHGFEEVADNVVAHCLKKKHILAEEREWIKKSLLPYHLQGRSQTYTCANLKKLRDAGYKRSFASIENGCKRYMQWLDKNFTDRWWFDEES